VRLIDPGGALRAGARVRGRIVGTGRDARTTPPTPLAWDVAFDAEVVAAR
jgi:hypothetical protein